MNKLIFLTAFFGLNGLLYAQDFQVSSEISIEKQLISSPVVVLEENKTASVLVNESYKLSLNVSPKSESQVLLDFTYAGNGYETKSQVLLDLNKEVSLSFEDQTFKFIISKVSS